MVWQECFRSEFVGFAVSMGLLFLLSVVSMFLARRADLDVPEARWWWTAALLMWSVNGLITSVYHLPVNIQRYSVPFTTEAADTLRTSWLALHVPRVLMAMGTHLAATQAALVSSWTSGAHRAAS